MTVNGGKWYERIRKYLRTLQRQSNFKRCEFSRERERESDYVCVLSDEGSILAVLATCFRRDNNDRCNGTKPNTIS